MNRWDKRSEALLAKARTVNPVPLGARERVRATLKGSIALAAAGSAIGLSTTAYAKLPAAVKAAGAAFPGAALGLTPLGPVALFAPITVGLALGLSAISPSQVAFPQRVAPAASFGSHDDRRPSLIETVPPRASEQLAPSEESQRATPASVAQPAVSKRSAEPRYSSLKQEATALEHVRVVLRQGDAELALRLLDRHRDEFPHGVLSFEALATRAVALCRLGQVNEAFGILARLELTAPGSGSVAQARAACGAAAGPRQQIP